MRCNFGLLLMLAFVCGTGVSRGQNLLTNGDFEQPPSILGWSLDETVTGQPNSIINSAQLQNFANQEGEIAGQTGLWLLPFSGNNGPYLNQNLASNAVLSQIVNVVAGQSYTFSGASAWESNYSGATPFLDPISPSGGIASPTNSEFQMQFLNASGTPLGAPITLDLETVQFGDRTWRQHSLMGTAPAGATRLRVTASATNMVANIDPQQSAFYDNFRVSSAAAPSVDLLTNGNLNAPAATAGWTIIEGPGTADTATLQDFANHTSGGAIGVWLRPFVVQNPEGDVTITQTVAGTAGGNYSFSGWSRWEPNYSGGIAGPTQTLLEMTFLNASAVAIGSPLTLDLRTQQMNDNTWRQHVLSGVAPAGTASVRVSGIAMDMFNNPGTSQSAFFDDFSLTVASAGVAGDYNGDGTVDAADYTVWRDMRGLSVALPNEGPGITPGMVTVEDYQFWRTQFGQTSGGSLNSGQVPEPATKLSLLLAVIGACLIYRRTSVAIAAG